MGPTYSSEEDLEEDIPSIYTEDGREQLLEDEEITFEEAAFMEGYAEAS